MPLSGDVPTATELLKQPRPQWLEEWASFAEKLRFEDIPQPIIEHARLVLLDTVGAIAAGSQEPEVRALCGKLTAPGHCAVMAGGYRNASMAALINGTAGTMLEIDEGNQFARGHPGIQVIPAALATAASEDAGGADLLTAIILGYELGARIGAGSKLDVAVHPHGSWGVPAAALTVSKLRQGDAKQLAATVNIASSLSLATSRRTMLEGATVRNTYSGLSNALGIMAADFQAAGLTGERDGIATVFGMVSATDFSPQVMLEDLGSRWEIARNYFKRHAACRYTHSALDALEMIMTRPGISLAADAIERIDVDTYVWAAQLDRADPDNMLSAKFSLPYALAATIHTGAPDLAAFREPSLSDPRIARLAARVSVREDPAMTGMLPDKRPSKIVLKLKDGTRHEAETLTNRGDTEAPYTPEEIMEKFMTVSAPVWGEETAKVLRDTILALDTVPRLGPLNTRLAAQMA